MVCIFSLYYKTLKKGRGEIKRERKKEKRVREQPPPLLLYVDFPWHCYVLCVCTWLGFMYKQEHQQSDNKFFRGLWTPNSFLHGSHGRRSPCRFYCYSQLMLNNRQQAHTECGLSLAGWMCRLQCKLQSVHLWIYTAQIGSYRACRACKMHESVAVKSSIFSKCSQQTKKQNKKKYLNLNLLLTFLFVSHFLCAHILTFCFSAPSCSLIKWNVSVVGFTNKIQEL